MIEKWQGYFHFNYVDMNLSLVKKLYRSVEIYLKELKIRKISIVQEEITTAAGKMLSG